MEWVKQAKFYGWYGMYQTMRYEGLCSTAAVRKEKGFWSFSNSILILIKVKPKSYLNETTEK